MHCASEVTTISIPRYPADFTRVNGVPVDEHTIQKWIEELSCEEYGFVKMGDTIVIKVGQKYVVARRYEEFDPFLAED